MALSMVSLAIYVVLSINIKNIEVNKFMGNIFIVESIILD
jgi:hypothetical protein